MNYLFPFQTFQRSNPIDGPFRVPTAITDKLLLLILDLFKGLNFQILAITIFAIILGSYWGLRSSN